MVSAAPVRLDLRRSDRQSTSSRDDDNDSVVSDHTKSSDDSYVWQMLHASLRMESGGTSPRSRFGWCWAVL